MKGSLYLGKQIPNQLKKTMAILLAVLFLFSLTAVATSAAQAN
jgi:hypothetical protein